MKQISITIKGVSYILKTSFRALMGFEEMTGRSATLINVSVSDSIKVFYCMLSAANRPVFTYSFEDFLDALDAEPDLLTQYNKYMLSLLPKEKAVADKKKVKKR